MLSSLEISLNNIFELNISDNTLALDYDYNVTDFSDLQENQLIKNPNFFNNVNEENNENNKGKKINNQENKENNKGNNNNQANKENDKGKNIINQENNENNNGKNNNIGRRKNSINDTSKARHSKLNADNIIKKLKRNFISSTVNLLNLKYCQEKNIKYEPFILKLQAEDSFINLTHNKAYNFMTTKTLKDMFSGIISSKFKSKNKDYNKKNIIKLYEKGDAKEIIGIMNLKVIDIYDIYIGKKENKYSNIYGLDNDNSRNQEKEYEKKYKKIALDMINILQKEKLIKKKVI